MRTTARVYPALNPSGVLLVFADAHSQKICAAQPGWTAFPPTILATAGQYSTHRGLEIVIEPA